MAKAVVMPKFGFTHEESLIVAWLVKEGDRVEKGDPLAEVSTDKVNMEIDAPAEGIFQGIKYPAGETVPVTRVIAYILDPGEELPSDDPADGQTQMPGDETAPGQTDSQPGQPLQQTRASARLTPVAARMAREHGLAVESLSGSGPAGRVTRRDLERLLERPRLPGGIRATPAARRLSREYGIPLQGLAGSGPGGRLQEGDIVRHWKESQAQTPEAGETLRWRTDRQEDGQATGHKASLDEIRRAPFSGMRKAIALNMARSAQEIPHITFDISADVAALEALRRSANADLPEGQARVSLTALLVKATAYTLKRHPYLNSRLEEDEIWLLPEANVGVAVALPQGLIVPVVHQADQKSVLQIANEIQDLVRRAKGGKLRGEHLTGGAFTISNLGMYGVERFTAIIHPPEAAILAVGSVREVFLPGENRQPVLHSLLSLTLSADHRIVDGASAAAFLADLRKVIEQPGLMLL